jgi:hypothetical protein
MIGAACTMYEEDNNGKWPSKLTDLIPTYLDDEKFVNCPALNKQYIYMRPKPDAPSDTIIVTCTQHNKDRKLKNGIILYKDGRVTEE